MAIDTNTLKEHFSNKAIPADTDFSNLIDLAATSQNAVADNKDGTEQLNGVKVQPFNKLSDSVGGRNMATNLGDVLVPAMDDSEWRISIIGNVTPEFFKIINQGTTQPITISFKINTPDDPKKNHPFDRINIDGCPWGHDGAIGTDYFSILGFKWFEIGNNVWKGTYTLQFDQGLDVVNSNKHNINLIQLPSNKLFNKFTVLGNSLCLYWGTQAIDWTPAPEDKVNVSDMRKPASDVAGIEEVNAKQDIIGYTPADDSKVVHDNHNNTITANDLTYDLSKTGITPIGHIESGSFNDLPLETILANATAMTDAPNRIHAFTTTTFYFNQWNGRKAQIAIADNASLMYFRVGINIDTSVSWNSWVLLSDDSKVVHISDMRKPASDVAGIEEVNAKQDKIGYTPADDSKVLHLSTGDTASRPTGISAGYQYFDTNLNKPIWYTGKNWVDSTGKTV